MSKEHGSRKVRTHRLLHAASPKNRAKAKDQPRLTGYKKRSKR